MSHHGDISDPPVDDCYDVPRQRQSTFALQAFSVAGPLVRNSLPDYTWVGRDTFCKVQTPKDVSVRCDTRPRHHTEIVNGVHRVGQGRVEHSRNLVLAVFILKIKHIYLVVHDMVLAQVFSWPNYTKICRFQRQVSTFSNGGNAPHSHSGVNLRGVRTTALLLRVQTPNFPTLKPLTSPPKLATAVCNFSGQMEFTATERNLMLLNSRSSCRSYRETHRHACRLIEWDISL